MQTKFLSNLVLLLVLNLFIKPVWVLGIDVQVQNILGPEAYGAYFVLLNFAFLFLVFFDFGLNNYNNRYVSRHQDRMPEQLLELGSLKLVMGVIVMLVMSLVGSLIGFDPYQKQLLWGVGIIIFMQSFLLFLRSNISGMQWYRKDVVISVIDKVLSIVFCVILIWGGINGLDLTIHSFIAAQILAYTISIIVAAIVLIQNTAKIRLNLNLKSWPNVLRQSFFYALLTFLMMGYYKVDAVMIDRLLIDGDRSAGLYAQGYKLLEAGLMFAYLISTLLLPKFSQMIKDREDVKWLTSLSSQLLLIPVLIVVVGALAYRHDVMGMLFDEGAEESVRPFMFLFLSLIPMSASYIYATLITADGDLKTLNLIAAGGMIFNVIGNYLIIPRMGIVGASIITFSTMSLVCLTQVLIARKKFALIWTAKNLIQLVALLIGLLIFSWCSITWIDSWPFGLIAYCLAAAVLVRSLGLFSLRELRSLTVNT